MWVGSFSGFTECHIIALIVIAQMLKALPSGTWDMGLSPHVCNQESLRDSVIQVNGMVHHDLNGCQQFC